MSESFLKYLGESNLNQFSIFSIRKHFVRLVIEEIKTRTVDVCQESVCKLKYSFEAVLKAHSKVWDNFW